MEQIRIFDNTLRRNVVEATLLTGKPDGYYRAIGLSRSERVELSGLTGCTLQDVAMIDRRSRCRDCITCGRPFLSLHAGHRMCPACRVNAAGEVDTRTYGSFL